MLVMVTLAAVRLTVPVNQAEETSRQLHIAQLATATYIVIYRVILFNWSRSKSVQDGKIFSTTRLCFHCFGSDFAISYTFWAGPVKKETLFNTISPFLLVN